MRADEKDHLIVSLCVYEESQGTPRAPVLPLALHFRIGTAGALSIQSPRPGRVLTRDSQQVASLLDKKPGTTYKVYAISQARAGECGRARVGSGKRLKLLLLPRQRATTILVSVVQLEEIVQKHLWSPLCAKFIKHAKDVKQKISITNFTGQYEKQNEADLNPKVFIRNLGALSGSDMSLDSVSLVTGET